jgi:hypothetical protein
MAFQLNPRTRISRRLLLLSFASLFFPLAAQTGAVNPAIDPKDAVGWFQRASDRMNLRVYDAASFHMKVAFKALPGLELLEGKKKPQIVTGDGVYEETWIAPHHWRREVTLGNYHAVEVESQAGRKMQSSSDYEPSRVLMLLDALFYPVRTEHISPDLARGGYRDWEIEHKTTGNLPYVLIRADLNHFPVEVDVKSFPQTAYIFLPSGMLVQSIDDGLTASWQDDATFAGHLVPRRLTIQSGDRTLLTADITVQAAGRVDPATFELPGETADPGMTLRPLRLFEVRPPERDFRCGCIVDLDIPILPLVIRQILDRHGVPREVELLDARNLEVKAKSRCVASMLDCMRKMKVRPATIDKSPAELPMTVTPILQFSHK